MRYLVLFFTLLSALSHAQQVPNVSPLELKEIMTGDAFIGYQPDDIRWSINEKEILFDWNPENQPAASTYVIDIKKPVSDPVLLHAPLPLAFDVDQRSYPIAYHTLEGNLVAWNKKTNTQTLLIQSTSTIHSIQRARDAHKVYFLQGKNLFEYDSKAGSLVQITNFVAEESTKKGNNGSAAMEKEEVQHFIFLQDQQKLDDWQKSKENNHFNTPFTIVHGSEQVDNIQISPSGNYVTYRLSTYPKEMETQVQHPISTDGHAYVSKARSKVHDEDPSHRLGIYNRKRDNMYYLDLSKLKDIRKKPAYLNDTTPYAQDRNVIIHRLKFSPDGDRALADIRSYDNKDRWIIVIDLENGNFETISHQHDEAWIGGPGISSWNMVEGTLDYTLDGKSCYFQSEESGYSHVYLYNFATKNTKALTEGKWEVHEVLASGNGKTLYITANATHPGNRGFYHLDLNSGKLTPILTKEGYHEVHVSPDEKMLAVRYSNANTPWELFVCENKPGTAMKQITKSTTKQFNTYAWRNPEVITFKASDGKEVYARLYENKADQRTDKPAVIFVHGAGYLQNAHHYWSSYHREYMFHNYLVDNGFTVLDIDYRASEGYGRDYRTAIYRHMGGRDLQDHIDGKKYLVENCSVSAEKVGIYGGSYGGFITLMALFTAPKEFQCGAALRAVTDWSHYNHEYTSNILNYPSTDPEAYKRSSPIYHTTGLERPLLLLHGLVDDNVQVQDIFRLSEKLIEQGKETFDMMLYPVEAHGFKQSYSWYDEYRRIYELMYKHLK